MQNVKTYISERRKGRLEKEIKLLEKMKGRLWLYTLLSWVVLFGIIYAFYMYFKLGLFVYLPYKILAAILGLIIIYLTLESKERHSFGSWIIAWVMIWIICIFALESWPDIQDDKTRKTLRRDEKVQAAIDKRYALIQKLNNKL